MLSHRRQPQAGTRYAMTHDPKSTSRKLDELRAKLDQLRRGGGKAAPAPRSKDLLFTAEDLRRRLEKERVQGQRAAGGEKPGPPEGRVDLVRQRAFQSGGSGSLPHAGPSRSGHVGRGCASEVAKSTRPERRNSGQGIRVLPRDDQGYPQPAGAGADAVNELSYVCLDLMGEFRSFIPSLSVRWHPTIDRTFFRRATKLATQGFGQPAIYGDPAAIRAMTAAGVAPQDAVDVVPGGCVELGVEGCCHPWVGNFFNLPKCLELALHDGIDPRTGDPLPDGTEVATYHTKPYVADTDDDGLDDLAELEAGYHWMYAQFYSWANIARRWPEAPGQATAYTLFNLVYRKYGTLTATLGKALGMRPLAEVARLLSSPPWRRNSGSALPGQAVETFTASGPGVER